MKRVIKNNYKFILGLILGLVISVTTVYAIDAYIESNKVTYNNHNKSNVEEAIDELYEKSGMHQEKWVDPILNGADPVFDKEGKLIPVEIKSNGEVYYANLNSEWYNYSEKRWANAVILIENPSNTNYGVGDKIEEDDIESYFVWIPRYQYKVWDLGKYTSSNVMTDMKNSKSDVETSYLNMNGHARLIDIKFGDASTIPKMAEPSTTGVYYTHPGFTLGTKNLNGLWVGKFETGGSVSDIIIKPNVTSLRNETVKTFFDAGYNYNRTLDSHMMKNTEWGAVAYLSHSIYGIGSEISINNNSNYITGYSSYNADQHAGNGEYGTEPPITMPWNSGAGYFASTTGNITGVYDMSGGTYERVAGTIDGLVDSSGFSTTELKNYMNNGYMDKYSTSSDKNAYNYRILGDATGEMGPFYNYYEKNGSAYDHNSWYSDYSRFIYKDSAWFERGGRYLAGPLSGQFSFRTTSGVANDGASFRIVVALTN